MALVDIGMLENVQQFLPPHDRSCLVCGLENES